MCYLLETFECIYNTSGRIQKELLSRVSHGEENWGKEVYISPMSFCTFCTMCIYFQKEINLKMEEYKWACTGLLGEVPLGKDTVCPSKTRRLRS